MPDYLKKDLLKLCKDNKVQLLISKFASGEVNELYPIYDPKQGLRYPIIDEIAGNNVNNFLQELFEGGVLNRKLFDKIIYCPSCNSSNIAIHYTCPHCKSFDIKKSALIEHIKCGYIDTEDHFTLEDKLICPKCNKKLITPRVDYHKAGVWCTCNKCTKSFDIPVPSHFCRDCKEKFIFDEAVYKDVYSYILTPEAAKEANLGWIMICPIMEFLDEQGFKVESPGILDGKSGTRHRFDLTAISTETNDTTVIDIATSDDVVSEQSVISMFAKIFDANPERACLVAIPKMNENGKRLATLYKIDIIEAENQVAVLDSLKSCMEK